MPELIRVGDRPDQAVKALDNPAKLPMADRNLEQGISYGLAELQSLSSRLERDAATFSLLSLLRFDGRFQAPNKKRLHDGGVFVGLGRDA